MREPMSLGEETILESLNRLEKASQYNAWLVEQIKPYLQAPIVEIGAGTGNITTHLTAYKDVWAVDLSTACAEILFKRFSGNAAVKTGIFDLLGPETFGGKQFQSIVCFNVLEHIEQEVYAMTKLWDLMEKGGTLCLLVPAHQFLYSVLDKEAGHIKRYSKKEIETLAGKVGFQIIESRYLNMMSVIPWLINFKFLRRKHLPEKQLNILNFLVPLLNLEKRIRTPFGLSLLLIARK